VVRKRRGRRQRVLDRWEFFDLGRRPRPVAVVEVVAEEVLVVLVVPGVGLFLGGLLFLLLLGRLARMPLTSWILNFFLDDDNQRV
jgi:hypothetical protein